MKTNENLQNQKFYDVEKNVIEYIESCEGKDFRFLIEILQIHLKPNSKVLELGIGAGKDLDILNESYEATGSDYSQTFLDIYKEKKPNADLLLLDVITLETERQFDCIYSNKVLHHLTKENLIKSLKRQRNLLKPKGILFHTFWYGEKEGSFQDLKFIQYNMDSLIEFTKQDYELIEIKLYKEMILNDSFYMILKPLRPIISSL